MAEKVNTINQPRAAVMLDINVFDAALERIRWLFDEFDGKVCVTSSGGKDSTTVIELAARVAKEKGYGPLKVWWLDQEAEFDATVRYQRYLANERDDIDFSWYQVPFPMENSMDLDDPWFRVWDEALEGTGGWLRPKEPNSIHEITYIKKKHAIFYDLLDGIRKHDFKGYITLDGMRCEESPSRRMMALSNPQYKWATWSSNKAQPRFQPIYDWSYRDIWAAIEHNGWKYNCNPGEAPIWMADFSHKDLRDVQAGDAVMGWERGTSGTRGTLKVSTVLRKVSKQADVVKVTLSDGAVIRCTPDHLWYHMKDLCVRSAGTLTHERHDEQWFGHARVGHVLSRVVDLWKDPAVDQANDLGWLAGIYDGEGSGHAISQNFGPVYERIGATLRRLGFEAKAQRRHDDHWAWMILGGRSAYARFLDQVKPTRAAQLTKKIMTARVHHPVTVISVEPDGTDEVFALETTTGNYVAWGLASKNSHYDHMFRYGVPTRHMRVSSFTHNQSLNTVLYLQEVEPDLWQRATTRFPGLATFGQLKCDQYVKELPYMFSSWTEYMNYLIDNLIPDEPSREKFRTQFKRLRHVFDKPEDEIECAWATCGAVVSGDHHGVGVNARLVAAKSGR